MSEPYVTIIPIGIVIGLLGALVALLGTERTIRQKWHEAQLTAELKSRELANRSEEVTFKLLHELLALLLTRRMTEYPALYELLSKFVKLANVNGQFRVEPLPEVEFLDFFANLNALDSMISYPFSSNSGAAMRELQRAFIDVRNRQFPFVECDLLELGTLARKLEVAMRADLSVYGATYRDGKVTLSHPDVSDIW